MFCCYWIYELCGVSYELCETESGPKFVEIARVKSINYELLVEHVQRM
jgi:hypothetical protein